MQAGIWLDLDLTGQLALPLAQVFGPQPFYHPGIRRDQNAAGSTGLGQQRAQPAFDLECDSFTGLHLAAALTNRTGRIKHCRKILAGFFAGDLY